MTNADLTAIESYLLSSPRFLAALGRPELPPMAWEVETGNWSWRDGVAEGTDYATRDKAEIGLAHWRRGLAAETEIQQLRAAFPEYIWSGLSVLAHGVAFYQGDQIRVEIFDGLWSCEVRRVRCGDWQTLLLAALAGDNYVRGTVLR
jgi:hypothetical protein